MNLLAPVLAAGDVMGHLVNSYELHFGPLHLDLMPLNVAIKGAVGDWFPSITKHVVMMMLAALVTGFSAIVTARVAARTDGRRFFPSMIEWAVVWLRDEVVAEGIHDEKLRRKWFPFFATLFFFILSMNVIGLLPQPLGATATGNHNVTMALALVTLTAMFVGGVMEKGPVGFWTGLVPHGVPLLLWPLVFVIEVIGLITKPFALMVRLFANMTAGHVMLAVLGGFILIGGDSLGSWIANKFIAGIPSLAFYLFINTFEVLIALIQAYIFTILSSIFVGMMLSHEH